MNKRFVFSFWPFVITLTAFLILCKLGFWQLSRAEQKEVMLAQFTQRPVVSLSVLQDAITSEGLERLNGREVNLVVNVLSDELMFVDNKIYEGRAGYKVLVPSVLPELNVKVLVDLGWVERASSRALLPKVVIPDLLALDATIKSVNLTQFMLKAETLTSKFPQVIQSPFSALKMEGQTPVLPLILYAKSNTLEEYPQTYKPVNMPPEKHHAYALQWFLLAVAAVVIFFFASLKPKSQLSESME